MKNEKGEDWAKYMNEMQGLQPMLNKNLDTKKDYHPIVDDKGNILNDPTVEKRKPNQILNANGKIMKAEEDFAIIDEKGKMLNSTYLDRKKKSDYVKENSKDIGKRMQMVINKWVDEVLEKEFTNIEYRALQEGQKWPVKRHKIRIETEHKKDPLPLGTDFVAVFKKKKMLDIQRFVWEV